MLHLLPGVHLHREGPLEDELNQRPALPRHPTLSELGAEGVQGIVCQDGSIRSQLAHGGYQRRRKSEGVVQLGLRQGSPRPPRVAIAVENYGHPNHGDGRQEHRQEDLTGVDYPCSLTGRVTHL